MNRTRYPRRPFSLRTAATDWGSDWLSQAGRPDLIINRLYQSGICDATALKWLGITAIINMDGAVDRKLPTGVPLRYLWHPIDDGLLPNVRTLHAIADQGVAWLRAGETVLVHCAQGWNRSGLVNGLILIRGNYVESGAEAVALIRRQRKNALGNTCFRDYLTNYESDPEGCMVNPPAWLRTPQPAVRTITNGLWQDDAEADLELSARWQRLLETHGDPMLTE